MIGLGQVLPPFSPGVLVITTHPPNLICKRGYENRTDELRRINVRASSQASQIAGSAEASTLALDCARCAHHYPFSQHAYFYKKFYSSSSSNGELMSSFYTLHETYNRLGTTYNRGVNFCRFLSKIEMLDKSNISASRN